MKKSLFAFYATSMILFSLGANGQMWIPGGTPGNLITDPTTNNVGIGVLAPTDPLTINRTMSLYEPSDNYRFILGRSLLSGLQICANVNATEASMVLHATNETGGSGGAVTFMTAYNSNTTIPYRFDYTDQFNVNKTLFSIDNTGSANVKNNMTVQNALAVNSGNLTVVDGNFDVQNGSAYLRGGNNLISGSNSIIGTTTIGSGTLNVTCPSSFSNSVNITGSLNVSGTSTLAIVNATNLTVNNTLEGRDNVIIDNLAGTGNRMVKTSSTGTLGYENMPVLSLSGSTITLSNGGTINSSVTIPTSGSSWVGTATSNLNMTGHSISNVATITGSGSLAIGGVSSVTGFAGSINLNGTDIIENGHVCIGGTGALGNNLYVNGSAYCTTSWSASDKRFKKNINDLKNVVPTIFKVLPKSYNFRKQEFLNERNFDDLNHFGFIAQDVKEIYPNLVKQDSSGYYAVNYIEFIPLLLQALKEEDARLVSYEERLSKLEDEIRQLNSSQSISTTVLTPNTDNSKTTLYQNVPNPFSTSTVIGFNIVGSFSKAFIGVYDLTGKQISRFEITPSVNSITISAGTLQSGMYVYSLVVDGIIIDSKKMVSTN